MEKAPPRPPRNFSCLLSGLSPARQRGAMPLPPMSICLLSTPAIESHTQDSTRIGCLETLGLKIVALPLKIPTDCLKRAPTQAQIRETRFQREILKMLEFQVFLCFMSLIYWIFATRSFSHGKRSALVTGEQNIHPCNPKSQDTPPHISQYQGVLRNRGVSRDMRF